ncbi:MAG: hypothetical protein ACP5QG_08945, partial [candidate division WOR-3 bacterium]
PLLHTQRIRQVVNQGPARGQPGEGSPDIDLLYFPLLASYNPYPYTTVSSSAYAFALRPTYWFWEKEEERGGPRISVGASFTVGHGASKVVYQTPYDLPAYTQTSYTYLGPGVRGRYDYPLSSQVSLYLSLNLNPLNLLFFSQEYEDGQEGGFLDADMSMDGVGFGFGTLSPTLGVTISF